MRFIESFTRFFFVFCKSTKRLMNSVFFFIVFGAISFSTDPFWMVVKSFWNERSMTAHFSSVFLMKFWVKCKIGLPTKSALFPSIINPTIHRKMFEINSSSSFRNCIREIRLYQFGISHRTPFHRLNHCGCVQFLCTMLFGSVQGPSACISTFNFWRPNFSLHLDEIRHFNWFACNKISRFSLFKSFFDHNNCSNLSSKWSDLHQSRYKIVVVIDAFDTYFFESNSLRTAPCAECVCCKLYACSFDRLDGDTAK